LLRNAIFLKKGHFVDNGKFGVERDLLSSKSFKFALQIVKLSRFLTHQHNEHTLSKQLLRSGTSIGALIQESHFAQSKADFLNKLTIALKEANETRYWLQLLHQAEYLTDAMFKSILPDCEELIKLLASSTKTLKQSCQS
jgi:four helix bundle protein